MFEVRCSVRKPVEKYRIKKDLPRAFHPVDHFRMTDEALRAGEVGEYFQHNDIYCFPARDNFVPWIDRRVVERWTEYFEPLRGNK